MIKNKNPLKILMLTWEIFPMMAGGLGQLIRSAVDELRNQDCDVTVLVPPIPGDLVIPDVVDLSKLMKKYSKTAQSIPGLDFSVDNFFQKPSEQHDLWPRIFSGTKAKSASFVKELYPNGTPLITRQFALAVIEYLRKSQQQFDVVIGTDWLTIPSWYLIKKELNIPFVYYINSTEYDRSFERMTGTARSIFNFEKQYFALADGIVAISDVSKKVLEEIYEVPQSKITVVFDDIDFKPEKNGFKELNKGKNILFIGRVEKQKGLAFLIDTMEKVVEVDPHVRLILAGDGVLLPWVVEQIADRGLEKNIIITGWVNEVQKKQLYLSSDLFVMPSPSEPFGLTPLEAIRSNVPVISSDTCGFLGVIPSTPTFKYYDTNRFFQLILFYLNDKKESHKLLVSQKKDLDKHSWPLEISKMIKLCKSLIKSK